MKVRFKYSKGEQIKYISHLDMIRVFERTFRRAKLPVSYTRGFNPRPKMVFVAALPVGAISKSEYIDVEFMGQASPEELLRAINQKSPPGLEILEASPLDDSSEKLSDFNAAIYIVSIFNAPDLERDIGQGISKLLDSDRILVERTRKGKKRSVDIAPHIRDIKVLRSDDEVINLKMTLAIGQQGSVSVPVVISEMERTIAREIKVKDFCREAILFL